MLTQQAYEHGYLHLLPLYLGEATGNLDKLGFIQISPNGNGRYKNYAMPGLFQFDELMNPNRAQLFYEHTPGTCTKREILTQFGSPSLEPAFIKQIFPAFKAQASYIN